MDIAEYAEKLFNLAHSQEMKDFISSLDTTNLDGSNWYMQTTSIQGRLLFVFYKSINQFFVLGYMIRCNHTIDFVRINLHNAFILPQHLLSRFRKRVLANCVKYDLRGHRVLDILKQAAQTILSIDEEIFLANTSISDKYSDNYFAWTRFGLIPVERYSDIVFCGTTFISLDMLNEKQKELYNTVYTRLLEKNLLKG